MQIKESHRRGFSPTQDRINKAKKIHRILTEFCDTALKGKTILDIGTGNGEIANYLAQDALVTSVDVEDNRHCTDDYSFLLCDENLPLREASFDFVVSNHVIEHVSNSSRHIEEIHRVLKPGGIAYLATPNRLWPLEVHHRVYLIHYLPKNGFHLVLKKMGLFQETLDLFGWPRLKRILSTYFQVYVYSDRVCQRPNQYGMLINPTAGKILAAFPLFLFRLATILHPTFIVLLEKYQHVGTSNSRWDD